MKKVILASTCFMFLLASTAQTDNLLGKWEVFEMTADGQTMSKEQLKQYGMDTDFIEILSTGDLSMGDKGTVLNGSWEYLETLYNDFTKKNMENVLKVTIIPSEEAKARGEGKSTMNYTVDSVDGESLTLSMGTFMTTTYKKSTK